MDEVPHARARFNETETARIWRLRITRCGGAGVRRLTVFVRRGRESGGSRNITFTGEARSRAHPTAHAPDRDDGVPRPVVRVAASSGPDVGLAGLDADLRAVAG